MPTTSAARTGYKPWGEERYGAAPSSFGYTGQHDEKDLGILFYVARWYDTVGEVRSSGGNVVTSPSLGNPYHADLSGITAQQAERLFRPTVQNPNRMCVR